MQSKLVSVLMTVYNGETYLHEAIQSILGQSYTHFELILVNDGSTDRSEAIIQSFIDKRIRYVKNESNQGLIKSLNTGLSLCQGELIARMDADDISMPDRLKEQVSAFNMYPSSVVIGSEYYNINGTALRYMVNKDNSDYLKAVLLFSNCFCHPTVMMKNIFKKKGINYSEEFKHGEDYRLWTDMAREGEFHVVRKPLLKYRSHSQQVSSTHYEVQLALNSKIRREYFTKLKFTFSKEEFEIFDIIGNNTLITSASLLHKIESGLENLKKQNETLRAFESDSFGLFLIKFWEDSCGNTSIGLKAYLVYLRSPLSKGNFSFATHLKMIAKCVLRMRW